MAKTTLCGVERGAICTSLVVSSCGVDIRIQADLSQEFVQGCSLPTVAYLLLQIEAAGSLYARQKKLTTIRFLIILE